MFDDQELLRRYRADRSEAAFAELVARYTNLVYSVALRRTGGNAELSKDVAQQVFTDLARKACSFRPGIVLPGWLHQATRYAAGNLIRAESRRRVYEQKAFPMNAPESDSPADWQQIRPLLENVLDRLGRADRDALLLRFFENRSLVEVGQALGGSEDAARKRVSRALDKLRSELVRRGVTASATALSAAISVNAVQVAPIGLAANLAAASLSGAGTETGATLTFLKVFTMTKLQAGTLGAIAIAAAVIPVVVQQRAQARLLQREQTVQQQSNLLAQLTAENARLSNLVAQAKNYDASPTDPSAELLRLRGEVGLLRQKTNELTQHEREYRARPAQSQTDTNLVSAEDLFIVRTTHAVDATTAVLSALKTYATHHNGQYPLDLQQLANSGSPALSLPGNLALSDFELNQAGAVDPQGDKFLIRIRVPPPNPNSNSLLITGKIDDKGIPSTSTWNVAP